MRKHQRQAEHFADLPSSAAKLPVSPLTSGLVRAFVDSNNSRIEAFLQGRCTFSQVGLEMQIHANDTLETTSAHGSFVVPPKLTITLLLEGDLDAALDGQPLAMTTQRGPAGYLWINRRAARLERWIRAGQRVRKVIVSLPLPAQVEEKGEPSPIQALLSDFVEDRKVLRWQPSARAIRYAEEILGAETEAKPMEHLESTIAALAIVHGALSDCTNGGHAQNQTSLGTRDVIRARKAREFILSTIHESMTVGDIASRNGMSVSTLQRVFKTSFGVTVNEFMRTRRLELARLALLEKGMTVGETAFQAGYSSAANFATAFQRAFGYPPSACLRG